MDFSLHRLDLTYEVPFQHPAFEAARSAAQILECFYETINPRFSLSLADLQASVPTSMGDVSIRVQMFNGSGLLEVGTGRFFGRFERLQSDSDLKIVSDCIELAEEALRKSLPNATAEGARFVLGSWLVCEGGSEAVENILKPRGDAAFGISPAQFNGDAIHYSLQAELIAQQERWNARLRLERSYIEIAHLFFACDLTYMNDGKYNSLPERIGHVQKLCLDFLSHFGLSRTTKA